MDDILLVMRKEGWAREKFYDDFRRSECYMPPLLLEEAAEGTFLESTFEVERGRMRYRLKNANEGGVTKVWRYQSYDSYVSHQQKRSTLISTLRKVEKMASDDGQCLRSAVDKIKEFRKIGYPAAVCAKACGILAADSGRWTWKLAAMVQ